MGSRLGIQAYLLMGLSREAQDACFYFAPKRKTFSFRRQPARPRNPYFITFFRGFQSRAERIGEVSPCKHGKRGKRLMRRGLAVLSVAQKSPPQQQKQAHSGRKTPKPMRPGHFQSDLKNTIAHHVNY